MRTHEVAGCTSEGPGRVRSRVGAWRLPRTIHTEVRRSGSCLRPVLRCPSDFLRAARRAPERSGGARRAVKPLCLLCVTRVWRFHFPSPSPWPWGRSYTNAIGQDRARVGVTKLVYQIGFATPLQVSRTRKHFSSSKQAASSSKQQAAASKQASSN